MIHCYTTIKSSGYRGGNVIIRFHDLLGEIQSFLENGRKDVLLAKTKDDFFGLSLAYLSDVFELLNELNRKMQGSDNNVITHTDTVKSFIAKLELLTWTYAGKHYNAVS